MEILHNNSAWKTKLAIRYLSIPRLLHYSEYLIIASVNVSYIFISVDVQRPLRGSSGRAELEKGRGRHSDRRRPSQDGGDRDDASLLAELVADSLDADDDGDTAGRRGGGGRRTIRVYRLHNRCSKKFVRVAGRRVDAAAPHDDMYST